MMYSVAPADTKKENLLLIDTIAIASLGVIYLADYLFDYEHTLIGWIVFALTFFYIGYYGIRKEKTRIGLFVAAYFLFDLFDWGISLLLKSHTPHLLIFLGVAGFEIYSVLTAKMTPQSDKETLLDHTLDKQNITNYGKYYVQVTHEVFIPERARYTHLQVIGSTGSGKTRLVFYPHIYQDIDKGAGLFIFDIKSNMREKVEQFVAASQRELEFYYFNLGGEDSLTYNPLSGTDATEITNRIFAALYYDMTNSEQYYKDIGGLFLSATIAILLKKIKTITFVNLYKAISDPWGYLKPVCEEYEGDLNAKYILDFLKEKMEKVKKDLSGLLNKISKFAIPEWTKQINTTKPEIDVAEIISKNKILLFQSNSARYQSDYKPLSILMMMHIQSEIGKRYSIQHEELKPFFVYLDEFDKIVYKEFSELINKAREAKVGIIFGHQALGDLEVCGKALQNQILTNARNKIILNIEDPGTAEYFAKAMGTRTIKRRVNSFSTKDGVAQSGFTEKIEEEFITHPNDYKFLKYGEGIVKIEADEGRFISRVKLYPLKDLSQYKIYFRPPRIKAEPEQDLIESREVKDVPPAAEAIDSQDNDSFMKKPPKNKTPKKGGIHDLIKNAPDTLNEAVSKQDEEKEKDKEKDKDDDEEKDKDDKE